MTPLPSEAELVARLSSVFATRRRDVLLGIGDDAAVVAAPDAMVLTTDTLVEEEDFFADTDPRRLGKKALAVNLSDLAAMGATPLWALLTLGLPKDLDAGFVDALAEGVREMAVEYGTVVVGGDLSASRLLFVSVTAVGRAPARGALTRSGARPGDALFVSGTLGAAAAGLVLLGAGYRLDEGGEVRAPRGRRVPAARATELARLVRHQLSPRPMVELGRALADAHLATAAIDLSDGLARDLHRLCRASGVGARLEMEQIPFDSAIANLPEALGLEPRSAALFGGEDFGLLFTVPKRRLASVERLTGRFALRRIGEITKGSDVVIESEEGEAAPLPDEGFDHFATRRS